MRCLMICLTVLAAGLIPSKTLANEAVWIRLPMGQIEVGSLEGDEDEGPVHLVQIDRPIEIMAHEVTKGEFEAFMAATGYSPGGPCRFYDEHGARDDPFRHVTQPGFDQSSDHPVVCVSAKDAQAFASWMTERTGVRHTLPTEAVWEYAARLGNTVSAGPDLCHHANISDLDRATAHYDGRHYFASEKMYGTIREAMAICPDGYVYTAPVGSFAANDLGIFDMIGNAWEWMEDCVPAGGPMVPPYRAKTSNGEARTAPDCSRNVIRGGSWHVGPKYLSSSNRSSVPSGNKMYHLGFRLVRWPLPPER